MSLFSVQRTPTDEQINQAIEKLSPVTREVLVCMGPAGWASRIDTLAEHSTVNSVTVRKVLKSLRNLGLAEYSPIVDEDTCRPCGSGTYLNDFGELVKERLIQLGRTELSYNTDEGQIHA